MHRSRTVHCQAAKGLTLSQIILGLGGLLSDAACCVIKDDEIASAIEQAKVSRQDRAGKFPNEALQITLEVAGVSEADIGCVALARPFTEGPESSAQLQLRVRFPRSEIVVVEHHSAHAASAYYVSTFNSASVLSLDRAGDYRSAVLFRGEGNQLTPVRELYFPDSLGDLCNRVTELLGYQPRADEHKVQWLSTFGQPRYLPVFQDMLGRNSSGWPHMNREFIDSDRLTQGGFSARFYQGCNLKADDSLSQETKADLAASLETAVSEIVIHMLGQGENACLAGGVAMNAILVSAVEQAFPNTFVQPVAGNAGTALGAALYARHNFLKEKKRVPFRTLCLGPAYKPEEVKRVLENCKLRFRFLLTENEITGEAVRALGDNKIVGWMQDRMEFGPRALGNRSIVASPLNPYSTENLNVYIKHRENFRKFAASVPEEFASRYFEVGSNARFLATVGRVRPEYSKTFEAAVLGQDTIRVHTVSREENPLYHLLLTKAGEATGLPVLYNTSFNLFGEPLVCTPRDAVRSFYSSGIDDLFVGNFHLEK